MVNLYYAEEELKQAKKELVEMSKSDQFHDAEKHWRNFLNHLDKVWTKAQHGCEGLQGKYQQLNNFVRDKRKNDKLLQYLWQARNADQHSVQTLAAFDIIPGSRPDLNTPFQLHRLDDKGNVVETTTHYPHPAEFRLRNVTNKGVIYLPPDYHNGRPVLKRHNPYVVGQLALKFYEEQLNKIKAI
ncbi:hypothetical protein [Siphonobacter sp. SORGH_AS_1065]|uniref:hypothetical protein n=1 Tax=Siphonobacter sp. SORGH_AS_1065 TaxID=3041795 RepID=UPI0027886D6C|nr:hypothetical protein [Siphonobacter sp. SORGH_AS_1065]MDQ1088587.1 hypothetical protein [Siphonobacter sp. SORGH_AS_1065]